ncbi:hypothetical protein KBTX_02331 [wastewater metagenome]|uniref:OmpA-like domain-containing protein n=2 Tax=unclassified sequences TaxID=12908 RepID=A0A5B8RES2_9ZZZZ|nr:MULTISPECIES: type VI secretion system membrane subunit TssM [Arhodomonas]QEA06002.1 hypothetical protein KBTEX_02331 [uncultured organism]
MKRLRWSLLKYWFLKYRPYFLGGLFFAAIFLVWWLGVVLGFSSLGSLLFGIGTFLVLSAAYVLLLYRGVDRKRNLEHLLLDDADRAVFEASPQDREEVSLLRERLLQAIERLHKQRGGARWRRNDALYELPWYMIVGQPAAGKSTMIYQSGLNFPFAERENARVAGMGGTRHCDWFFSADAILLDTAGRYMDGGDEAGKWKAFLSLLRDHRRRCPLNGLIVAVNISDVITTDQSGREQLAKRLRERIQEARESLESSLPIYLVFTKCDLIQGFAPFFERLSEERRCEVLGHTFAHRGHERVDWSEKFRVAFERLRRRWLEVSEDDLVRRDIREARQDGVAWQFPLEFAALARPLEQFVAALTNANPYQDAPLLRGFYFVSALQDGEAIRGAWARDVHRRFALEPGQGGEPAAHGERPFFINELFTRVIIPDQHLIGLYASHARERRRKWGWIGAGATAMLLLCAVWSLSAWYNHREIARLDSALTQARSDDAGRPDAYAPWQTLDTLRGAAAAYYRRHSETGVPWSMRFGLYQGERIEAAVRRRYFAALRPIMLEPVAANLTKSLYTLTTVDVYRRDSDIREAVHIDGVAGFAQPESNTAKALAGFGRNALGTYVMLSSSPRADVKPDFLIRQLPAWWYPELDAPERGASRHERGLRRAGRQIDFYARQLHEPDVPRIDGNEFLISSSRRYIDSLLERSLSSPETIMLGSDTLFAFGRGDYAGLQDAGRDELDEVAERLLNTPRLGEVIITGHADRVGSDSANRRLSLQRARTVRRYLIGRGVPSGLVEADGVGSSRPLVTCGDDLPRARLIDCLAPNRRVEIEVHKQ